MKVYILGNTGTGKTATAMFLALLYRLLNSINIIYSNCSINIKNFIFSEFMFLPMDKIKKGNCMLIFDDYKALTSLNNYASVLAVLSRKTNIEVIFTIQYYTHITKEVRELCQLRIEPYIKGQKLLDGSYEKTASLHLNFYPSDYENDNLIFSIKIENIFTLIDKMYDTNQIPEFLNEYTAIQEIANVSESFKDVYQNVQLYKKSVRDAKRIRKEVCKLMEIECLY